MPRALRVRVHGEDAIGRIRKFNIATLEKLREAARARSRQTVQRLREEVVSTYTKSPSGQLTSGRGFGFRTTVNKGGINIFIYVPGVRHLPFITSLIGGRVHLARYPIIARPPHRFMVFFAGGKIRRVFPRNDRRFRPIIGIEGGNLVFIKRVIHPGFPRDVIAEVVGEESQLYQQDMVQITKNAVITIGD